MSAQPRTQTRALAGLRRVAIAAALLLVLAASVALALAQGADAAPRGKGGAKPALLPAGEQPNFVLIQTDDQTIDSLYATFTPPGGEPVQVMPNTISLLDERGVSLTRYYASYPLCCPSRVTLLTGRYAHNHNVRGNNQPNGGFTGFSFRGANEHNLATWLQRAGYRTIHIGKILNGYGDEPYDDGSTVPPGWSAWYATLKADTHHYFYGYRLNINGTIQGPFGDSGSWDTREYGKWDDFGCPTAPLDGQPCYYETDVFNRIAVEEMWATPAGQPLYLQLDYTAPHGDFRRPAGPQPATRHYNSFAGARLPHNKRQGLNEGNVSDKPRFIRDAPLLTPTELRTYRIYYEKQLESLRSIDEGVKMIVDTLRASGRLGKTYVIFTSDNGFFFGEHRLTGGKFLAYEPATRLPFLMRGPGIKPGTTTGELAGNVDVAPTILDLAGVEPTKSVDGRSLVPYVTDTSLRTRRPILFESFVETNDVEANGAEPSRQARRSVSRGAKRRGASASIVAPPKDYIGIRLGRYKYIEWPSGEKELYDITKDPYELNNIVRRRNFAPIRNFLHVELRELAACSGRTCREATPKMPLTKTQQRKLKQQREKEQREREREQKRREEKRKAQQQR